MMFQKQPEVGDLVTVSYMQSDWPGRVLKVSPKGYLVTVGILSVKGLPPTGSLNGLNVFDHMLTGGEEVTSTVTARLHRETEVYLTPGASAVLSFGSAKYYVNHAD